MVMKVMNIKTFVMREKWMEPKETEGPKATLAEILAATSFKLLNRVETIIAYIFLPSFFSL